jgi:MFS family permease
MSAIRAWAGRALFSAPHDDARRSRWSVLAIALAFPVLTLALLGWHRDAPAWDRLYAEDGRDFIGDAQTLSLGESILTPYNGYLHLLPRLLGALFVDLDPSAWGAATSISAALIRVSFALALLVMTRGLVPSLAPRLALVVIALFGGYSAGETLNNICNLQWFLVPVAVVAMMRMSPSRMHAVTATVLSVLAALSSPIAAVIIPLAVVRLIAASRWTDRVAPLAFLPAIAVQLSFVLTQGSRSRPEGWSVHNILDSYWLSVMSNTLFGTGPTRWIFGAMGWTFVAFVIVLIAGIGATLIVTRTPHFGAVVVLVAMSAIVWVGSASFAASAINTLPGSSLTLTTRYAVSPILLLATGLAAAFGLAFGSASGFPPGARRLVRIVTATLGAFAVVAALGAYGVGFRERHERVGPSWVGEAERIATECAQGADSVEVALTPGNWRMVVYCPSEGASSRIDHLAPAGEPVGTSTASPFGPR